MALTTNVLDGVTINEVAMGTPSNLTEDANSDGVVDGGDNFIELYNTTGSPVDISGFQLYMAINNIGSFSPTLVATVPMGTTIEANGYFTFVEPGFTEPNVAGLDNVGGDGMVIDRDDRLEFNFQSTYGLYSPNSDQFILVAADQADETITDVIGRIQSDHPTATQFGTSEFYAASVFESSFFRIVDGDTTWVAAASSLDAANCFAEGTLISTPEGERLVESLAIGDLVRTAEGQDVPVLWLGRQTLVRRFAGERARLVRVEAGVLENHSDLWLTQDHGLLIDGLLINAGALVGLPGVTLEPLAATPKRRCVYHVETEGHQTILANGAAAESFIDYRGRAAFDNFAEYEALYGTQRDIEELHHARVSVAAQVPQAIQDRLAARAVHSA